MPIPIGAALTRSTRVIETLHSGRRSASPTTAHTRSGEASMSSVAEVTHVHQITPTRYRIVGLRPIPVRIFLSYGHDSYAPLAARIKCDLESHGHDVWFDLDRLKAAGEWERYIEEGFEFVSSNGADGRFVLLMTPHSVRRPDGYCLNELARAHGRNLPIIPVMVADVEPPLSICRLQWLDMRRCVPVEQHEEHYARRLGELLQALTEKQVPFEGVQQKLLNYLQPIAYADDVTRHLARFTGREWVMSEVDDWLASSRRVLWLTGEAGVGKSAIAARLCDKRPEIVAYHFCRFGNAERVDARKALFSLAYQLSTQLPVYRDRLNASPVEKIVVETNLPALFDRLFVNLVSDAVPLTEQPHVLLIDALDEASHDDVNELASLIGSEFDRLPAWLRLIVTSRPHEVVINSELQALDPRKLDAGCSENLEDIRRYLRRELRPFTRDDTPAAEVISAIVDKSEGLFLYVTLIRQEIEHGRLSLSHLEAFPQGLGGVYLQWFKRYFPDLDEYRSRTRPALEVICAAREPLHRGQLCGVLAWDEYALDAFAADTGSLFPFVDDRVRPVHQSVRDWLADRKRAGDYRVHVREGDRRLADFSWEQYRKGLHSMSDYTVVHAPFHLAACELKGQLRELLLDPVWIDAKLRVAGVVAVLADYDLALDRSDPNRRSAQLEREGAHDGMNELEVVHEALRLSSNVVAQDPDQFGPQMIGRLLSYEQMPAIAEVIRCLDGVQRTPWLRPLRTVLHPPGTALLRTLTGHTRWVRSVALTPDGRRAISGATDGSLKVWDVESGRELLTIVGQMGMINSVAVTPDGERTVSGSNVGIVKLWELSSGRELGALIGHDDIINGVAVTPDGRYFLSASTDTTVKVWDLSSGRELRTLRGHTASVQAVAVTPDGLSGISASADCTLKLWELHSGRELRTFTGHSSFVYDVAITPDGRRAVSASWDNTLKVWDLTTARVESTLLGHDAYVDAVAVTPDGQRAVSGAGDRTLKVWDLSSGRELVTLWGHTSGISAVRITPDSRRIVSASADSTLKIWDLNRRRQSRTRAAHADAVKAVALEPRGPYAVSASVDQTLKVWDRASGRELRTLAAHSNIVFAIALTPDGRRAVSGSRDETLKVWNLDDGRELFTLSGHSAEIVRVVVTPDGQRAVSASSDSTLKVWDIVNGRELRTLRGHTQFVSAVAVTPDGSCAVSAGGDGTLRVWQLESGRELLTAERHIESAGDVVVTPDGQRVITGAADRTLKTWELSSGRDVCTMTGHSGAITRIVVTGDGSRVVSSSWDHTVKVWDASTGREHRTLIGHTAEVNDAVLSSDGKRAISASADHTVKIWDVQTGAALATFTCDGSVECCAVDDDHGVIIAGDAGGGVHFLRLEGF